MMARKTKGFVLLLNIVFAGLVLFEMVKAGRKAGRKYGKYNTANTRALERAANFQPSVREAFKSQLQPQVASSPPPSDDNDVSLEGFGFGEADQALNEQQIIEADDISAHRKYYADQASLYTLPPSSIHLSTSRNNPPFPCILLFSCRVFHTSRFLLTGTACLQLLLWVPLACPVMITMLRKLLGLL